MLPRLLSLLALSLSLAAAADSSGFPSLSGNLGLTGSGYGDVYGGKIKEGVYGAGGRVGGQLGLTGLLGMGSGRRKRQDFGFVPFASLGVGAVAPAPAAATPAPAKEGGRRRRDIDSSALASAIASAGGATAIAGAASGAGPGRFTPFESLFPPGQWPPTSVVATTAAPAASTVAPTPAPTTVKGC